MYCGHTESQQSIRITFQFLYLGSRAEMVPFCIEEKEKLMVDVESIRGDREEREERKEREALLLDYLLPRCTDSDPIGKLRGAPDILEYYIV